MRLRIGVECRVLHVKGKVMQRHKGDTKHEILDKIKAAPWINFAFVV